METKICTLCKEEHSISEYVWKNKALNKKHPWCDSCRKEKSRLHYKKHQEKNILRTKKNKQKSLDWYKSVKKDLFCCNCGESDDSCLDFHHIDSTEKEFNISEIKKESIQRIRNELNKCACLCANCHRKHHAGQKIKLVQLNISR